MDCAQDTYDRYCYYHSKMHDGLLDANYPKSGTARNGGGEDSSLVTVLDNQTGKILSRRYADG
jgi:hypothetical protein